MPQVPEHLKKEIYVLYGYATSNNPEICIPYTRKLVGRLKAATRIAGVKGFDEMLDRDEYWANEAVKILSSLSSTNNPDPDGWGRAMVKCEAVIQDVIPLIHDPEKRFATVQEGMLKFPAKEEVKK